MMTSLLAVAVVGTAGAQPLPSVTSGHGIPRDISDFRYKMVADTARNIAELRGLRENYKKLSAPADMLATLDAEIRGSELVLDRLQRAITHPRPPRRLTIQELERMVAARQKEAADAAEGRARREAARPPKPPGK